MYLLNGTRNPRNPRKITAWRVTVLQTTNLFFNRIANPRVAIISASPRLQAAIPRVIPQTLAEENQRRALSLRKTGPVVVSFFFLPLENAECLASEGKTAADRAKVRRSVSVSRSYAREIRIIVASRQHEPIQTKPDRAINEIGRTRYFPRGCIIRITAAAPPSRALTRSRRPTGAFSNSSATWKTVE